MATSQYKNGFKIGGSTYKVNIKSYDSQSSVTMAGTLAKQAIQNDNVDLLFASSTPETVNAVASQAETLGTPLVCSNIPWESWYGNLGGNPTPGHQTFKPKYTVMYFLGAEHLVECFIPMWNRIGAQYGNNHIVAAAFPNDADGNAFRAVFPPIAKGAGYTIDLSTPYADGLTNYTSMISQFKSPEPTSSPTCRCRPTSPPCGSSPSSRASSRSSPPSPRCCCSRPTPTRWAPRPTTSPPTAGGCRRCRGPRPSPGRPASSWRTCTPSAGMGQPNANISNYSLFEIAYQAFMSVNDPHNKEEVAAALFKVNLPQAVAGPLNYTSTNVKTNPAPGVAITPPVGIQWQKGTTYALEAKVVDNTLQPLAKITGDLLPTFK